MNQTYLSSDDSELLRKAVKSYNGYICMEMGIGYGSNLLELKDRFEDIVGTDIRLTEGFGRLKGKGIDLIVADRASCFREGTFDFVILNPPYLPSEQVADNAVDGGATGFEVPSKFLEDALRVLQSGGTILIVLSSETSAANFERFCRNNQLVARRILSKSVFFETLSVYELRPAKIV